jgi:integrase
LSQAVRRRIVGAMPEAPFERTATPGIYRRGSRYVVMYRDPHGRQRKRAARTLAEARALKSALQADVHRGEYRELSRIGFAEYVAEWGDAYQGRTGRGLRPATRADYRRILERYALPFFGRRRLVEIEPRDVKAFARHLAGQGLKPNSVRNIVNPLRALLATAVEDGLIRANPAAGLRLASSAGGTAAPVKSLTPEELAALIEQTPPEWQLFVRFLAHTGLRIGEAVALRWEHVDLGRRRVLVRERVYRGAVDRPKSRYGRRDVPLSPGMARGLWELRKRSPFPADQDPVFASQTGTPTDSANLYSRVFKPAAQRAGVGWAGFHTLRHTAGTTFFRAGWNAKQVQMVLGHHSPAFTLETYVHLLPEDLPDPDFLDALEGSDRRRSDGDRHGRDAMVHAPPDHV